jgi:hypothetical protein
MKKSSVFYAVLVNITKNLKVFILYSIKGYNDIQ